MVEKKQIQYGIVLKTCARYNHRGTLYRRGVAKRVSRKIRDELVNTKYFVDVLIEDKEPEADPVAARRRAQSGRGVQYIETPAPAPKPIPVGSAQAASSADDTEGAQEV